MKRIRNLSLFALVCSVGGFLVVGAGLSYIQARVLVFPPSPGVNAQSLPAGLPGVQQARFSTSDGLTLGGWYSPPATAPGPVILFVHGHAGNRNHFLDEAAALIDEGYGVLLFDLRNHGASEGTVTTMGLHEVRDVQAAFAYLAVKPEVDASHIVLYGHSMGGATAILAMQDLPHARALVVDTAYATLASAAADGVTIRTGFPSSPWGELIMWFSNLLSGEDITKVRPIEVVGQISPRPILFIHGSEDPIIPVSHMESLYAAAELPKYRWVLEGGSHGDLYERAPDEWAANVLPFLAFVAKG